MAGRARAESSGGNGSESSRPRPFRSWRACAVGFSWSGVPLLLFPACRGLNARIQSGRRSGVAESAPVGHWYDGRRRLGTMTIALGISFFVSRHSIGPVELAHAVEDSGFESLWL